MKTTKILIEFVPHESQRYETAGDWYWDTDGVLHLKVSQLPSDEKGMMAWAIALHELFEVGLCIDKGITQEAVDAFDLAYEKTRPEGDDSEPGDHIDAPYRNQHSFATAAERMFIAACGIAWEDYARAIEALPPVPDQKLTG